MKMSDEFFSGMVYAMVALLLCLAVRAAEPTVTMGVYEKTTGPGQVLVKVMLKAADPVVYNMDLRLTYNSANAAVAAVAPGSLAGDMLSAINTNQAGIILASFAGTAPIGGEGPILLVTLQVTGASQVQLAEAEVNEGMVEVVIDSTQFVSPALPVIASPADSAIGVALSKVLDWADSAHATTYDLYLWKAAEAKPSTLTATHLVMSQFGPANLVYATAYNWQVIAKNPTDEAAGPIWTFRTQIAPVANAQSVATDEGTPLAIVLTGTDADGDLLTYAVVSQPGHGQLRGTAPNLTYAPEANYNGADSFTFKVNDGTQDSAPATVTVTVTAVNNAPIAVADSKTTAEDTPLTFPVSDLAANDAPGPPNESTQTLTVTAVSSASSQGGTVSVGGGNITYTPASNFNGTDTFSYTVTDNGTPALTATATVTVTVTAVNDAPALAAIADKTIHEGATLTFTASASDIDLPGPIADLQPVSGRAGWRQHPRQQRRVLLDIHRSARARRLFHHCASD